MYIAKTRLLRLKGYCSQSQMLQMYKTLIWSALEIGVVCYAHTDNTTLNKLQQFQDTTLRQLNLQDVDIDTLDTRRKCAFANMVYKQVVLQEGPGFIRESFPLQDPGPRAHLERQSTAKHSYQLSFHDPPQSR